MTITESFAMFSTSFWTLISPPGPNLVLLDLIWLTPQAHLRTCLIVSNHQPTILLGVVLGNLLHFNLFFFTHIDNLGFDV